MGEFVRALMALGGLGFFMLVLSVVFMLLLREVWCWYWKINETTKLLTEIRDLLVKQKQSIPKKELETSYANIDKPVSTLGEKRWAQPK